MKNTISKSKCKNPSEDNIWHTKKEKGLVNLQIDQQKKCEKKKTGEGESLSDPC